MRGSGGGKVRVLLLALASALNSVYHCLSGAGSINY